METEIQTAQKHSADLREEAERQTERLLKDRSAQLEKLENDAKELLIPLINREELLKTSVTSLTNQKIALETTLTGLDSQINGRRQAILEADQAVSAQKSVLDDEKTKVAAVHDQISAIKQQIEPLQNTLVQLTDNIDKSSVKRDELRDQIGDYRTEFEILKNEKERVVTVLDSKREKLELDIIQAQEEMNAQRQDLAQRIRIANDREEVLKRRENKVARGEADNRRNASLMNL